MKAPKQNPKYVTDGEYLLNEALCTQSGNGVGKYKGSPIDRLTTQ